MANNPISPPLNPDLPTNWSRGQIVAPNGSDVGLDSKHGYNYLMQQVNTALSAINTVGEAFPALDNVYVKTAKLGAASGVATLGADGKLTQSQAPTINADDVSGLGTAATANIGTSESNVPVLGTGGKLSASLLPDLSSTYVPTTRTVNNKPLSTNITLNASDVGADASGAASTVQANLTSHTNNKSNPHGVTATQVGAVPTSRTVNGKALSADVTLSAADVGADASGAADTVQTNLTSHINDKNNPHGVKAEQVNLSSDSASKYPAGTETVDQALATLAGLAGYKIQKVLSTVLVTSSQKYTIPDNIAGSTLMIRAFGGGGGGGVSWSANYSASGGGGGYMATWTGDVAAGDTLIISIGDGGVGGGEGDQNAKNGSPTVVTVGTETITASGGACGERSGSRDAASGGDGGTGGGAGSAGSGGSGGNGDYGGGGGGSTASTSNSSARGGRGGTYGGGGGSCYYYSAPGGTYGGAGGELGSAGSAGTDTTALDVDFKGSGTGGSGGTYAGGGGGGYGGNGGNASGRGGGGGGGYGGNGGTSSSDQCGGGGGGYGLSVVTSDGGTGYGAGGNGEYSRVAGAGAAGIVILQHYVLAISQNETA